MAVTSISSPALPGTPRLNAEAPRLPERRSREVQDDRRERKALENVVGGLLELVIHAVEDWRERRGRLREPG